MSKAPSELSQLTRSTYETVREQLKRTAETIDDRTDKLRARVAARAAGVRLAQSPRRSTVDDMPASALGKVGGR